MTLTATPVEQEDEDLLSYSSPQVAHSLCRILVIIRDNQGTSKLTK